MSEPAQKAFSPAPVRMTQRIASSALKPLTAATSASAISGVTALSFSGLSRVMMPTCPSRSTLMLSPIATSSACPPQAPADTARDRTRRSISASE